MSLNAKLGIKSTITWNGVRVRDVKSLGGIPLQNTEVDVTDLDSLAKEYIAGLKDFGSFEVQGHYVPSDPGQAQMLADAQTGTVRQCVVDLAALNSTYTFNAFLTNFAFGEAAPETPITFTATVRITGAVDIIKANLTALVITGGGTLTPSFDPEVYEYNTITTGTSCTVTPTLTGADIKVSALGTISTVASGTASPAIATAAGVTTIAITSSKDNGVSTYRINVAKA